MNKQLVRHSRFLSLILRHKPQTIGLTLDGEGWADVDELIEKAVAHGRRIDKGQLREIVASNDKKRFAFSDDARRIRAVQGHSVNVDLGLEPQTPPSVLYHGTATRFLSSIFTQGLIRGSRRHVHLSADMATAVRVGSRHGKPVVLELDTAAMVAAGHVFFRSENGVWLTEQVPPDFLKPSRA